MTPLALCADDFGQSRAINRGILALARQGRLSDVSCMVNMSAWADDAPALARCPVRCGLHLNLTHGQPLSPELAAIWPRLPSLPRLILQAHAGRLPLAPLAVELGYQLRAFEQGLGRAPDHIDGHQHVHHLPGLRRLVLDLLPGRPGLMVRHTGRVRGPGAAFKRGVIAASGGWVLGRSVQSQGRAQNHSLVGVYDFLHTDYRHLVQGWLRALPAQGGLLFCHPGAAALPAEAAGTAEVADVDPIAPARLREAAYLGSAAFVEDLARAGVVLDVRPKTTRSG